MLRIIFFSLLSFSSSFGQDIIGKWITLKSPEAYMRPSINVYEFNESKLIQYDFDEKIDSAVYKVQGNKIDLGKAVKTYRFIDVDILELTGMATFNGRDTIMSERLLRITKTKSEFQELKIENISFPLFWNNVSNIISFNNCLSTNDFQISRFKICKNVRLEKLDSMMFISVFCANKREFVFTVKSITKNKLTLFTNVFNELNVQIKNTNNNK